MSAQVTNFDIVPTYKFQTYELQENASFSLIEKQSSSKNKKVAIVEENEDLADVISARNNESSFHPEDTLYKAPPQLIDEVLDDILKNTQARGQLESEIVQALGQ